MPSSAFPRRSAGWQRLREYLACPTGGKPLLTISSDCKNLIRTLPQLTFDERVPEDVSDRDEDHAAEALRYALMSRPSPATPPTRPIPRRYDPFSRPAAPTDAYREL